MTIVYSMQMSALAAMTGTSVALTTLAWACITLLYAAAAFVLGRIFFWRQVASPSALFAALLLIMLGVGNIMLEGNSFANAYPFASTPVRLIFFLTFAVFPDGRFVASGRYWLRIGYAAIALRLPSPLVTFSGVASIITTSNRTSANNGGLPDAVSMIFVVLVLLSFVRSYCDLATIGERLPVRWLGIGVVGGLVVLGISVWFNAGHGDSAAFFVARTLWFLLVTLAPVAVGVALLRGRRYDWATVQRHALIYGALAVVLAAIYLAGIGVGIYEAHQFFPDPRLNFTGYIAILLAIVFCTFVYQPLRMFLQNTVDRLRYPQLGYTRAGFDAFAATIYDDVQLDSLSQHLITLLQTTLRPHAAALLPRNHLFETAAALTPPKSQRQRAKTIVAKPQAATFTVYAQTEDAGVRQLSVTIAPDDPLWSALIQAPGSLALEHFAPASAAATTLVAAQMRSAQALVDRGEVVGLIALSDNPQMLDERDMLATLAAQTAPVLRVAQRLHEQDVQAFQRERVEQELQMARRIQQSFLPHTVPTLTDWQLTPFYQPAREVGGDFYDFLMFADGRLGLVIGDVTDKGVPAALVMATTRSMLRAAAQRQESPGAVLAQVNDLLCPDMPANMYVTCFYAILDLTSGHMRYANAGQEPPYHRHDDDVTELFARGMPLGLMPDMRYEEHETTLLAGDAVLLYSDGVVEAHNRQREMFGDARLADVVKTHAGVIPLNATVLADLARFTAADWVQEDDITLVTLQRSAAGDDEEHIVDTWSLPSVGGNERLAMQRVGSLARAAGLAEPRVAHLETAVAEATLNAMEHGNAFQSDQPVTFAVLTSPTTLSVRITDQGSGPPPETTPTPDITAKLAEEQSPRGWGLFLITQLVDDVRVTTTPTQHTVTLRMALTSPSTADATSADNQMLAADHAFTANDDERPGRFPQERSTPMPPAVTLTVRPLSPTMAAIDVQGDITAHAEDALTQAYTQANSPTTRAIILNFTGLAYMNSIGIGLLVTLLIRMKRQRQALLAYGLSAHYRHIFALTRLDEAIILADTEVDAVSAANRLG